VRPPDEHSLEVSSPSFGGILPGAVYKATWKREERRISELIGHIADAAGVDPEDVFERLESTNDNEAVSLLDLAVDTARHTSNRQKLRMLGRVASAAIAGDDARIQRSTVLVSTLVQLEPPHIRVLVALNERTNIHGPAAQSVKDLAEKLTDDDPALIGVLAAQLASHGAAILETSQGVHMAPEAHYKITEMGQELLKALEDS
jgi:hypothetical protein